MLHDAVYGGVMLHMSLPKNGCVTLFLLFGSCSASITFVKYFQVVMNEGLQLIAYFICECEYIRAALIFLKFCVFFVQLIL